MKKQLTQKEAEKKLTKACQNHYQRTGIGMMEFFDWHDKSVVVIHEESAVMHYKYARVVEIDKEWVAVVTEHQGYHFYDRDDLYMIKQYKECEFAKIEDLESEENE